MAFAIKTSERVRAWELGAGSFMEQEMILRGKIVAYPGGVYELFTREAPEGRGEMAKAGDFFKVDGEGFPCPNEREFFLLNHRPLEGDWYTQVNQPNATKRATRWEQWHLHRSWRIPPNHA